MNSLLSKYEDEVENLMFTYRGNPTADKIQMLLELVEKKLHRQECSRKILKRVINVLIEVLQNVFKHREDFVAIDYRSFIFYLLKYDDRYCIVSGNYIHNHHVDHLKEKLNRYIALSEPELDATYKDMLLDGTLNNQGGAGLGLMEIIRKSSKNVKYELIPINGEISFFLIEINIRIMP